MGIPWRSAFALQADGWYLRSDCIWHKGNPMPSSVKDRPTTDHEYIFILSKRQRYFWDAEAVKEPVAGTAHSRGKGVHPKSAAPGSGIKANSSFSAAVRGLVAKRNIRSVWKINSHAYPEAHFATFPPGLPERCIRAGSSQHGACSECGAPWVRVVSRPTRPGVGGDVATSLRDGGLTVEAGLERTGMSHFRYNQWLQENPAQTVGWAPSCTHDADRRPCVVLDPFSGAGTTGLVAARLGREYIGLEQSTEYAQQSRERIVRELGASREQLEQMGGDAPIGAQVGLW